MGLLTIGAPSAVKRGWRLTAPSAVGAAGAPRGRGTAGSYGGRVHALRAWQARARGHSPRIGKAPVVAVLCPPSKSLSGWALLIARCGAIASESPAIVSAEEAAVALTRVGHARVATSEAVPRVCPRSCKGVSPRTRNYLPRDALGLGLRGGRYPPPHGSCVSCSARAPRGVASRYGCVCAAVPSICAAAWGKNGNLAKNLSRPAIIFTGRTLRPPALAR